MKDSSQYILSSLDNALGVLNLFFEREALSAAQASELLGISRTAAFRLLVTLENRGYLTRGADSSYRLGIKIFSLGQLAQSRMALPELVRPQLSALADATGETAQLAIMDGPYHMVFIDKALGRLYLRMDTATGYRRWAHQTASGKAMLARQPEDFLEKYVAAADMRPLTPTSITTLELLRRELDGVREAGWACDNEESEPGLTCYAASITGASSGTLAAISCSGPTTRMVANRQKNLSALLGTVKRVSREL